jgi:hypothetical protein
VLGDNSARFAMHFGGNRCILGQFHRVGLAAFALLQHASPRSLEVPQGTFYIANHDVVVARIRWISRTLPPWRFCQDHGARLVASARRFSTCLVHCCTAGTTKNAFLARTFRIISQQREVWLIFQRFICRLPQRVLSQALPMLTHQWG